MKIIVCVKQVAHIYVRNGYDPQAKGMVSDGLVYMINPHDEAAVEGAIRLREKHGGSVTVITLGPEKCETTLRWCLAMGADHAVHVIKEECRDLDPWITATVLSGVISEKVPDLVLFGKKAIDDNLGMVGTFVAELLNLPVVTEVTGILTIDAEAAVVHRSLDRGNREEVVCSMPAVFSVDKSLNRPRYPTFPARKSARTKPVEKTAMPVEAGNGVTAGIHIVRLAQPKLRPKKILSPDSNLSAAARINFVMTGGMQQKKGGTVGGDPEKMADGIIDFLREKNVIE